MRRTYPLAVFVCHASRARKRAPVSVPLRQRKAWCIGSAKRACMALVGITVKRTMRIGPEHPGSRMTPNPSAKSVLVTLSHQ